ARRRQRSFACTRTWTCARACAAARARGVCEPSPLQLTAAPAPAAAPAAAAGPELTLGPVPFDAGSAARTVAAGRARPLVSSLFPIALLPLVALVGSARLDRARAFGRCRPGGLVIVRRIHRAWDLLVASCVVVAFQNAGLGQGRRARLGRQAAAVGGLFRLAVVAPRPPRRRRPPRPPGHAWRAPRAWPWRRRAPPPRLRGSAGARTRRV